MSDIVWPTTEACEIHSMALEFLTWPHMEKFYGESAAEELRRIHLSVYLQFLCYGVSVDHFQHLVYEKPDCHGGNSATSPLRAAVACGSRKLTSTKARSITSTTA